MIHKRFPKLTKTSVDGAGKSPSRQAHTELDRAVDRCYRKEPFPSDRARVEYLFQLYEQLTAQLLPVAARPKRVKKALSKTAP